MYADATAFSNAHFGLGTVPILLDDVACTVYESRIINCPYDNNTVDCTHSQDAGVRCKARELPTHSSLNYVALTFSSFVYLQVVIVAALD